MREKKRIVRGFTGILIHPYARKQNTLLEALTSVPRYPQKGRVPYNGYYVKPKTFATRLFSPDFIQELFPDYEVLPATRYTEDIIYPFEFNKDIHFTEIETSFVNQMINLTDNRVFCNLQTGFGKTFIMIRMITIIQRKAIILCYSTTVLNQWAASLKNHTTCDMKRVMLIKGSSTLYDILMGKRDISSIDIFLCTPALIGSFADKYGWTSVSELFEKMHLGIKIYDEAHRNIKILTILDAYTNVKRNFYLSADYSQANQEKRKLFFQTFYDTPIIGVSKEIEASLRYINVMVVNFNSHPDELEQLQVIRKNFGFSNIEYMKYEFEKSALLDTLKATLEVIIRQNADGRKILIATSMIEHVEKIYKNILKDFKAYKPAMFYSELPDEDKQYAKSEANIIIATIGSFGPGVDVKGIGYVIAMDQFDTITDNQLSGRARPDNGKDAFYFMLNDAGFDYCNRKISRRVNYITKQKAKKVTNVNL